MRITPQVQIVIGEVLNLHKRTFKKQNKKTEVTQGTVFKYVYVCVLVREGL